MLYIAIIAAVIISLLVFYEKKKDKEDNSNPPEILEDNNDDDSEDVTITYATSLTLNLPTTINVLKDKSVKFKDGYVSVEPSSLLNEIHYEIVPRYNSDPFGIEFNNSTITAKTAGSYNLKFKVLKAENSYITREVTIYVYEDEANSHLTQIKKELVMSSAKSITDVFNISSQLSYSVVTDSKIENVEGTLNPLSVGTSNIQFIFTDGNVEYLYEFTINIKPEPIYKIVTTGVSNNTIEINIADDDVFWLHYEIVNTKGDPAYQKVNAVVGNSELITALQKGETTLTIICNEDSTVKLEITVIVI